MDIFFCFFFKIFLNVYLFLRERDRERERERERERIQVGDGQRKRGRQNPKQAPHCAEPDVGLELTNCEIMT